MMDRNSFIALAAKMRELRQLSPLYWRLGREYDTVFICDPTFSLSWWLYLGTVDELVALPLPQLSERIQYFARTRSEIWFPPSRWKDGIGEAEIEEYHGRDTYER